MFNMKIMGAGVPDVGELGGQQAEPHRLAGDAAQKAG